jgi:hypothetical protein
MFHSVKSRRQLTTGVEYILKIHQQLAKRRRRATNAREDAPVPVPLPDAGGRREGTHTACVDQLTANSVHHQVVVTEKVYSQYGKTDIRQQKNPPEGGTMDAEE